MEQNQMQIYIKISDYTIKYDFFLVVCELYANP